MKLFLILLAAVALLLLSVSLYFMKTVLAGRPDRKERMSSPLMCEDTAEESDTVRKAFVENRTRLRAQGAEFDKTMTPVQISNGFGQKLFGYYRLRPEKTHDWIISVHGYKDDHRFMLPYVMNFYEKGYNVFTQDNRAHGLSDGKFISMGWHDKDDIYLWMDEIVSMDSEACIYVHGVSMGGAATMMVAGLNHPAVKGYIEDCGYTRVWDIFETVMNRDNHLPAFPILHCCRLITNIFLKYDYKKASSLEQMAKCSKPMLFIHGEKDAFIPLKMGEECYEAHNGVKELYIAPEAGHAESMDFYPEEYFERVCGFIDRYCRV